MPRILESKKSAAEAVLYIFRKAGPGLSALIVGIIPDNGCWKATTTFTQQYSPRQQTTRYDYVNISNTQSNDYPPTVLISGVHEVSEDMWLHILIGTLIRTGHLESIFVWPESGLLCASFLAGTCFIRNDMYLCVLIYVSISRICWESNRCGNWTEEESTNFQPYGILWQKVFPAPGTENISNISPNYLLRGLVCENIFQQRIASLNSK